MSAETLNPQALFDRVDVLTSNLAQDPRTLTFLSVTSNPFAIAWPEFANKTPILQGTLTAEYTTTSAQYRASGAELNVSLVEPPFSPPLSGGRSWYVDTWPETSVRHVSHSELDLAGRLERRRFTERPRMVHRLNDGQIAKLGSVTIEKGGPTLRRIASMYKRAVTSKRPDGSEEIINREEFRGDYAAIATFIGQAGVAKIVTRTKVPTRYGEIEIERVKRLVPEVLSSWYGMYDEFEPGAERTQIKITSIGANDGHSQIEWFDGRRSMTFDNGKTFPTKLDTIERFVESNAPKDVAFMRSPSAQARLQKLLDIVEFAKQ